MQSVVLTEKVPQAGKYTEAVTGVIALMPATPDSPMKNPAIMLSHSSIRYMTALVNVPDISMDLNFFHRNLS